MLPCPLTLWCPDLGTMKWAHANTPHTNPCSIEHGTFLQVSIQPLLSICAYSMSTRLDPFHSKSFKILDLYSNVGSFETYFHCIVFAYFQLHQILHLWRMWLTKSKTAYADLHMPLDQLYLYLKHCTPPDASESSPYHKWEVRRHWPSIPEDRQPKSHQGPRQKVHGEQYSSVPHIDWLSPVKF